MYKIFEVSISPHIIFADRSRDVCLHLGIDDMAHVNILYRNVFRVIAAVTSVRTQSCVRYESVTGSCVVLCACDMPGVTQGRRTANALVVPKSRFGHTHSGNVFLRENLCCIVGCGQRGGHSFRTAVPSVTQTLKYKHCGA